MTKTIVLSLIIGLLIGLLPAVALMQSQEQAKQKWQNALQSRQTAANKYQQDRGNYLSNRSPANEQKYINSAKKMFLAALDEAEAWLEWRKTADQANSEIPDNIKESIKNAVDANLAKIDPLRVEVREVTSQLEGQAVFLRMLSRWTELLADVARNTGYLWVYQVEQRIETTERYESQLREKVKYSPNKSDLINKLNLAKNEIASAKNNVSLANTAYNLVVMGGIPLIPITKFVEGNDYLRQAKLNLLNAHSQLEFVYNATL